MIRRQPLILKYALVKPGYSLVELLVVVLIISLLAAVALPTVKDVLVERKTSTAAIQVKGFFEAARARAIGRGRPVSVILERLSSRTDGSFAGAVPQSSTAANPVVPITASWSTDTSINFAQYNSCIRLTMAEVTGDIVVEAAVFRASDDEDTSSVPSYLSDIDSVSESDRVLMIANTDGRLRDNLVVGNTLTLVAPNERRYHFVITGPQSIADHPLNPANFFISVLNEGNSSGPFGSNADINVAAAAQNAIVPYQSLPDVGMAGGGYINTGITELRIASRPKPIISSIVEMPRGTCIDLSLSGLSSDDSNVNSIPSGGPTTLNYYRDCRREFASDWVLPPISALGGVAPIPTQLRPVYIEFSPSGTLSAVLCNAPQLVSVGSTNPPTYISNLRRIEPHTDVCLFIGRLDQVTPIVASADLAAALDAGLKTNLTDDTGYWVRISPASGGVITAPALTSHILEDIEEYRSGGANENIGLLLDDSRTTVFTSQGTSQ
jgi:prepilin-type N-terminal cleavage/methylation domain-containing protein